MIRATLKAASAIVALLAVMATTWQTDAQQVEPRGKTSYAPVAITEPFASVMARMVAAKPGIEQAHRNLLAERYDLADLPAQGVTMSRGKPVQGEVRVKLPAGTSWDQLASLSADQIRDRDLFPRGFLPLPHPNHPEGGMVFPHFDIDELKRQEARDLTRFDLDFDLPDHLLPEFPPPIFLTTRPDLGTCRRASS